MKEIIDIPYGLKKSFDHENEWTALLCAEMAEILNNGIVIPDNPTNGDMIKALFPNTIFSTSTKDTISKAFIRPNGSVVINDYCDDWWNAQYKAEIEPQEKRG